MELVSTSKLKRAQDRVVAARPYAEALRDVIADLVTPDLAEQFPLLRRPAPPAKGGPAPRGGDPDHVQPRAGGRLQRQPDQGSAAPDRGARGGGLHGRSARVGKKGVGFFRYLGRTLARGAASTSATSRRPTHAAEIVDAADRGTTRRASWRAWSWCTPRFQSALSHAADHGADPAGRGRRRGRSGAAGPTTSSRPSAGGDPGAAAAALRAQRGLPRAGGDGRGGARRAAHRDEERDRQRGRDARHAQAHVQPPAPGRRSRRRSRRSWAARRHCRDSETQAPEQGTTPDTDS